MPEDLPGAEILNLGQDFPPVPTAVWEAAIAKDLKGADYAKKLVWRTDEGLAVRPYYRAENLAGLEAQTQTSPGQFPFARGSGKPWEAADAVPTGANVIRADELGEAGGNAVQQLGYALAAGVERLTALAATGTVDEAARSIEFVFSVGSTYFLEIAKLRAARLIWAQAVAAFGPADPQCALARIHARTTRLDKSVYDHYTNLLRVTTEALAAAVGGCDRLTVEPFGFDQHLAVNIGRILRHEAHVDAVADPAGGSYYVEALTDSLARAAWKLFQQVEAARRPHFGIRLYSKYRVPVLQKDRGRIAGTAPDVRNRRIPGQAAIFAERFNKLVGVAGPVTNIVFDAISESLHRVHSTILPRAPRAMLMA